MRLKYSIIFGILTLIIVACLIIAHRSRKAIGAYVSLVLVSLIPPIIGNLHSLLLFSLFRFSYEYCDLDWKKSKWKILICVLLAADALQYAFNPFLHQAFTVRCIQVEGLDYYQMVPLLGQTIHRIIDYSIFAAVIIIFVVKTKQSAKVYSERYLSILGCLLVSALWQFIFVVFRIPIDRSMIGIGIAGLAVFFFSLCYRPLRVLDRILADMASGMPQAMYFIDAFGKIIWANDTAIKFSNIKDDEFDEAKEGLIAKFGELERDMEDWEEQFVIKEDGVKRYYAVEMHTVKDDANGVTGSLLSIRDNTGERRSFEEEKFNATHDGLTGLYNKDYLYNRIQEKIISYPDTQYLVLFLDVKNFKIVNDVFGMEFGDYSIKCIAEWIRKDRSDKCVYGRIAGDTFGMCIPKDEFDIEKTEKELSEFIVQEGSKIHHIPIHIGVYEVNKEDAEVSVMFDRAHLAITSIKDDYHEHIIFYDNEMREKVLWDQEISAQLPKALEDKELRPYLQPIVNTEGRVVGAEALVRWIHPEKGFMNPGSFIPVFEKNGLIVEVDKFMWRSACEILAKWQAEGKDMFLSVNISPKDFYFTDVTGVLKEYVKEFKIDPSKLRIEITETVMMSDITGRMETLKDLKNSGFIVEMDDFGSGYSSLNLLKDMPVDVLKIDMMFLSATDDELKALTIVKNILNLSSSLEMSSLTEGVETQNQFRMLNELGCNLFQGFYFAKPMPIEEFDEFCEKFNSARANMQNTET